MSFFVICNSTIKYNLFLRTGGIIKPPILVMIFKKNIVLLVVDYNRATRSRLREENDNEVKCRYGGKSKGDRSPIISDIIL